MQVVTQKHERDEDDRAVNDSSPALCDTEGGDDGRKCRQQDRACGSAQIDTAAANDGCATDYDGSDTEGRR